MRAGRVPLQLWLFGLPRFFPAPSLQCRECLFSVLSLSVPDARFRRQYGPSVQFSGKTVLLVSEPSRCPPSVVTHGCFVVAVVSVDLPAGHLQPSYSISPFSTALGCGVALGPTLPLQ